MGTVQIDMANLLMFGITTLVGCVIYYQRSMMSGLQIAIDKVEREASRAMEKAQGTMNDRIESIEKHRLRPLEAGQQDVMRVLGELRTEVLKQFGDFRVDLLRTHPTKDELDAALSAQGSRLVQIEQDIRKIADSLMSHEEAQAPLAGLRTRRR